MALGRFALLLRDLKSFSELGKRPSPWKGRNDGTHEWHSIMAAAKLHIDDSRRDPMLLLIPQHRK